VEDVDWCRTDLKACLGWLEKQGYSRVALVGHSLGGVKGIYYQCKASDPRVVAVVSLSSPRLSYTFLSESESGDEFLAYYEQADALVKDRRPGTLMDVKFPVDHLFSAANFIGKMGPKEKYDVMTLVEDLHVPLLALGGSRERRAHLRDVASHLAEAAINSPQKEAHIIEGANHFYKGKLDETSDLILRWLNDLQPLPAEVAVDVVDVEEAQAQPAG
jgi:alpha/beta superfamily hydrolase